MKKILALLTVSATATALPVLNPGLPHLMSESVFLCNDCCSCWSLRYGYRGDFVYDAKLRNAVTFNPVQRYSVYTNAFTLTLNLWNCLDIYGIAGASSQYLATPDINLTGATPYTFVTAPFETKGSWGVGARILVWTKSWKYAGTSFLKGGFEFFKTFYGNSRVTELNGTPPTMGGTGVSSYRASQFTLSYGQLVRKLSPYVALKWSNQRVDMNGTAQNATHSIHYHNLKSQRHFGWACGATLLDVFRMNITAEARFVDENAATVSAEVRF